MKPAQPAPVGAPTVPRPESWKPKRRPWRKVGQVKRATLKVKAEPRRWWIERND